MRLDASGNLGLGVSSPSYKIDVKATAKTNGFDGINLLNSGATGSVFTLAQTGTSYTYGSIGSNQSWLYSAYGDLNITCDQYSGGGSGVIKFSGASGTERMRIASDGNVVVGGTDASYGKFSVRNGYIYVNEDGSNTQQIYIRSNITSGVAGIQVATNNPLAFYTNNTERMRIDSTGNVAIGTTTTSERLNIQTATGRASIFMASGGTNQGYISYFNDLQQLSFGNGTPTGTGVNGGQQVNIDASGNLLVGKTGTLDGTGVGLIFRGSIGNMTCTSDSATTAYNTYHLYNLNATNNGYRFYVNANGGISNYSGNNINLSDERTKHNIELSGSYIDKICAIPVKLFNYKIGRAHV
jgi:hypothetical protein